MSTWQWDEARQKYYILSEEESAYVYQDGTRVYLTQAAASPAATGRDDNNDSFTQPRRQSIHAQQRTSGSTASYSGSYGSGDYTTDVQLSEGVMNLSLGPRRDSTSYEQTTYTPGANQSLVSPVGYAPNPEDASTQPYQSTGSSASVYYNVIGEASTPNTSYTGYPAPVYTATYPYGGSGYAESSKQAAQRAAQIENQADSSAQQAVPSILRYGDYPAEYVTEPGLHKAGYHAHALLRGSGGTKEELDPEYKVRDHKPNSKGPKFFVPGKVIKVLWPELAGAESALSAISIKDSRFGENIHVKVRWFIVVRVGKLHSTCVPIQTYGGRGTNKTDIVKWQHGIAFSGNEPPQSEDGILAPVRVTRRDRRDYALDKMSLINYGKMYTVEHNVKVYDYGNVHPTHLKLFEKNWLYVIQNDPTQRRPEVTQGG